MKRLAEEQFKAWQCAKRRKPLIVRGARQIGKTWSIAQFGKTQFSNFVKIDLEKRSDLHPIFDGDLSPEHLISQLELALNVTITTGDSLVFFDEIQSCPRALMSLRYFYEDLPDLHVVAAGSLLEFALEEIPFPVGRVQFLNMYPLNFYEFLLATGKTKLAEKITQKPEKLPTVIHDKIMGSLRDYFFVGGFPEAVKAYCESKSTLEAFRVQKEILISYQHDFAKYATRADKTCLNMILENAAQMVGEQNKYSKLADGFSNPTIRRSFDLLCMAKLLNKIPATQPKIPLSAGANVKKFKTTLVDIGFMQSLSQLSVAQEIKHKDLLDIYRGKLAEQFIGQELRITQDCELFYWAREARSSNAEVDYLIKRQEEILPLEVKSGKGGSLRSLRLMLDQNPECPQGLVLYSGEYAELPEQNITFLPLYYAGQLNESNNKGSYSNV